MNGCGVCVCLFLFVADIYTWKCVCAYREAGIVLCMHRGSSQIMIGNHILSISQRGHSDLGRWDFFALGFGYQALFALSKVKFMLILCVWDKNREIEILFPSLKDNLQNTLKVLPILNFKDGNKIVKQSALAKCYQ